MKAANNKIIVRCDQDQKNKFIINGVELVAALSFETNYREKSPVACQAVSSNNVVNEGDILLCHHNTFYQPSPHYMYDDLYSIPSKGTIIFCKLNTSEGSLLPIYGNVLCDKIDIESELILPSSVETQYTNRILVTDSGYTEYKKGDILFTRPYGAYQIVYNWNGELKRTYKCYEEQVCGILKK